MYLEVNHCVPYTRNIMMNKVKCLQFREESKSTTSVPCQNSQDFFIEPVLYKYTVLSIVSNSVNPRR